MVKRKIAACVVLVLVAGLAFLSWNWRNEARRSFKIRFEEIVDFGFEAFASKDLYNAEEILSSLFDKFGNELNMFRKIDRPRQLRVRALYGYLLFRNGNFQKSERVWRPIFSNLKTMEEFVATGESQRKVLLFYLTELTKLEKFHEILRIFDLCYDDSGNATAMLLKFENTPLIRSMAGEAFYRGGKYKKALAVLKVFFENPTLFSELSEQRKATVRLCYGKSLICDEKEDLASDVLSPFFDEDAEATKLFRDLNEINQISCRVTYAQLLLKSNEYEKILKLLEVFFDDQGRILLQPKNSAEEATIRNVYGYSLCKYGRYKKAKKVWKWFFENGNREFVKNFSSDEIDLLNTLYKNIHRISV